MSYTLSIFTKNKLFAFLIYEAPLGKIPTGDIALLFRKAQPHTRFEVPTAQANFLK